MVSPLTYPLLHKERRGRDGDCRWGLEMWLVCFISFFLREWLGWPQASLTHRSPTRTGPCTLNAVGLLSLDVETRGLPPLAPPPRVCGEVYLTLPYLLCGLSAGTFSGARGRRRGSSLSRLLLCARGGAALPRDDWRRGSPPTRTALVRPPAAWRARRCARICECSCGCFILHCCAYWVG